MIVFLRSFIAVLGGKSGSVSVTGDDGMVITAILYRGAGRDDGDLWFKSDGEWRRIGDFRYRKNRRFARGGGGGLSLLQLIAALHSLLILPQTSPLFPPIVNVAKKTLNLSKSMGVGMIFYVGVKILLLLIAHIAVALLYKVYSMQLLTI